MGKGKGEGERNKKEEEEEKAPYLIEHATPRLFYLSYACI